MSYVIHEQNNGYYLKFGKTSYATTALRGTYKKNEATQFPTKAAAQQIISDIRSNHLMPNLNLKVVRA